MAKRTSPHNSSYYALFKIKLNWKKMLLFFTVTIFFSSEEIEFNISHILSDFDLVQFVWYILTEDHVAFFECPLCKNLGLTSS